jgi:hypothetical protein
MLIKWLVHLWQAWTVMGLYQCIPAIVYGQKYHPGLRRFSNPGVRVTSNDRIAAFAVIQKLVVSTQRAWVTFKD